MFFTFLIFNQLDFVSIYIEVFAIGFQGFTICFAMRLILGRYIISAEKM